MKIPVTRIQFPEIFMETREAHKLRGFFGTLFKEESVLLHNHFQDGSHRYAYPLVQYKVIQHIPCLIGIQEGASLLASLFLKIKELKIGEERIPLLSKNIQMTEETIGVQENPIFYQFSTFWMGLNQDNFSRYKKIENSEKNAFLSKICIGNILSFYKLVGYHASEPIAVKMDVHERETSFKGQRMVAFAGTFSSNAVIPDFLGIGKSVSRGFGAIKKRPHSYIQ